MNAVCARKNCAVKPKGLRHSHCLGCGYPVYPLATMCGECMCEDEG